jgi:prepilin-type N-terminal cleavage/methylation domain-containing protein
MIKINQKKFKNTEKGFTLVELLVTLSIFLVISAMTLANYPQFNSRTSLTGLAQEISISVREAQVYGVSVKSATSSTVAGSSYPAYGIFFGKDAIATTYAGSKAYSLFFDKPGVATGKFGLSIGDEFATDNSEMLDTTIIGNGNKITQIRGYGCELGVADGTQLDAVFIVFRRPNPDAKIKVLPSSGTNVWSSGSVGGFPATTNSSYKSCGQVNITIVSRDAQFKKDVVVYSTGQITVAETI